MKAAVAFPTDAGPLVRALFEGVLVGFGVVGQDVEGIALQNDDLDEEIEGRTAARDAISGIHAQKELNHGFGQFVLATHGVAPEGVSMFFEPSRGPPELVIALPIHHFLHSDLEMEFYVMQAGGRYGTTFEEGDVGKFLSFLLLRVVVWIGVVTVLAPLVIGFTLCRGEVLTIFHS